MIASQIKYWVFGAVGAVGAYLLLIGNNINPIAALGFTLGGAAIGAMVLGGAWDVVKSGEKATTINREIRDERARQELMKVRGDGAKQLEAPQRDPTNEQGS